MKLLFLLVLLPLCSIAQTAIKDSALKANSPITYNQIITSIKEASVAYSCENLTGNAICFEKLEAALSLNVFKYYNLEDNYSSELKKANFMESQDYKEKLNNLKKVKEEYQNTPLYIELNKMDEFKVFQYDLTEGGFFIRLSFMVADEAKIYNSYYEISQLPTKLYISDFYNPSIHLQKMYDRMLLLPLDKAKATKMEDVPSENLKMIIIFKPLNIKTIDLGFPQGKQNLATTNNIRLLILDSRTSDIYYDQNYYTPKQIKKK